MSEIELDGLNGSNLLAFMAAVGTLRILDHEKSEWRPRLRWHNRGVWKPALCLAKAVEQDELIETLHDALASRINAPEFNWTESLSVPTDMFRKQLIEVINDTNSMKRNCADWFAALGSEAVPQRESKRTQQSQRQAAETQGAETDLKKKVKITDTAFNVTSGNQKFVSILKTLAKETKKQHLEKSLFREWLYAEDGAKGRTLRWDPSDDRRHAYRADDPTDDKSSYPQLAERGANRLALEAIPCFPVVPTSKGLTTTGFFTYDKETFFSWPIWQYPASLDVIHSLLNHPELIVPRPRRKSLTSIGIVEVFRSKRIIGTQYYGNFTPSQPCLV